MVSPCFWGFLGRGNSCCLHRRLDPRIVRGQGPPCCSGSLRKIGPDGREAKRAKSRAGPEPPRMMMYLAQRCSQKQSSQTASKTAGSHAAFFCRALNASCPTAFHDLSRSLTNLILTKRESQGWIITFVLQLFCPCDAHPTPGEGTWDLVCCQLPEWHLALPRPRWIIDSVQFTICSRLSRALPPAPVMLVQKIQNN